MNPNLISYAVPVFFAAIILESVLSRRKRAREYRLAAALADIDAGIASQVVDVFLRILGLMAYLAIYRYRVWNIAEGSVAAWVIGLVGIDFLYYFWHRASHTSNILWAVHAVHHQSQDFNFAVALRQPAFEGLSIIPFHLPLALLGVDPATYASCYAINLIYQFFIHTEWVPRIAPLEWVLNTPSCHRVHHAINPHYLDRNFGGILAVWDRIFGTYEPESAQPVYGVTHALESYNPVWGNLAPWRDVGRLIARAPTLWGKVAAVFAHPAWRPRGAPAEEAAPDFAKYDPRVPRNVGIYVAVHFSIVLASGATLTNAADRGVVAALILPGAVLLVAMVALGGWTEGRPWALGVDLARQVASVAVLLAIPGFSWNQRIAAAAVLGTVFVMTFAWLRPDRHSRAPVAAPSRSQAS